MPNATPRDLDPNFTQTTPPEDTQPEVTQDEKDDDTPMIVHKIRFLDDHGVQQEKELRMPLAEWPAYSAKHGL